MNLSCYIIDDEPAALKVMAELIRRTPGLELAGQATDPVAGLNAICSGPGPDVTFLDVDMPGLSGLALAGLINAYTTVIFTTAHREYAADAYDRDVVDFLLKPIGQERFLKSILKARHAVEARRLAAGSSTPPLFFVKTGIKGQVRSIRTDMIRYAAAALNYVEILVDKEKVVTYLTLGELLERLPAADFSQVHKSFIVRHDQIQLLEYARLRLKDGTILPVGRVFRATFREKIQAFLLASERGR